MYRILALSLLIIFIAACSQQSVTDMPETHSTDGPRLGTVTQMTFVGDNGEAYWSPDGKQIIFQSKRDGHGCDKIYIMNADGSNIQRLTIATGSNEHPTFSPDGRLIAFSSTREGGAAIYLMRADGSNQTRVSKGNGLLPDWGPRVD